MVASGVASGQLILRFGDLGVGTSNGSNLFKGWIDDLVFMIPPFILGM